MTATVGLARLPCQGFRAVSGGRGPWRAPRRDSAEGLPPRRTRASCRGRPGSTRRAAPAHGRPRPARVAPRAGGTRRNRRGAGGPRSGPSARAAARPRDGRRRTGPPPPRAGRSSPRCRASSSCPNNVRKGFAEAKQVDAICKRLKPDVADGVRFALVTGWRRAEVFSLAWSQVDWNGGFVRLEPGTTKNREGRSFPLTPALRVLLERRQELTRGCERGQARIIPLVFHRSGRRIESFRRSWKEACKKAGLPGLLFHDLRRSAVRNLERAGVPRSVAMKLTGHKTESIYRRYAIVAESDLREAGAKLSAMNESMQRGQATT